MKKLISIFSLTVLANSASAVTLYQNGVTSSDGLTLGDLLADGWAQHYNELYSAVNTTTQVAGWQAAAGAQSVFIGAIDLSGNVIVGATGLASEVLSSSASFSKAVAHASSNLYWYNVSNTSFGFTPTEDITLANADLDGTGIASGTPDDGLNDLRLSWHTMGVSGGWRAGGDTGLSRSTNHRKIVLFGTGTNSVPDGGATFLLTGLGLLSLMTLRKRLK